MNPIFNKLPFAPNTWGKSFSLGTALYFKTRRSRLTRTIKRSNRTTCCFLSNNTYC